jgi:Serpin (serine protease inhibitor)
VSRYARERKASAAWACFRPWILDGPNTNMTQTSANTRWPSNTAPAKLCGTNFADGSTDVTLGLLHDGFLGGNRTSARLTGVQHDTAVQVDNTGTVIADGTTEGVEPTAARRPINVELNYPFFYATRDNQTGALLFTGIAMNPHAG